MSKIFIFIALSFFCFTTLFAQQRVVAECTIEYKALFDSSANKEEASALQNSSKIVYIKGNNARVDLISTQFVQSVIYDKTNNLVAVLREFGTNKVLTKLSKNEWQEKNKKYEGYALQNTNEVKNILGYNCTKAYLQTKEGNQILIYYTTSIIPSVKDYEYQFKDVPGFVLAYEISEADKKIFYTATKLNLNPVLASRFTIPNTGYRVLQ
jgi:GLPGLI family protein